MGNTVRRTFEPGQTLTFVHAQGTRYEQEPVEVTYAEQYRHGFDEHVIILPSGSRVAVLDRDLNTK